MCQVLQKVFPCCFHHHSLVLAIPCHAGFTRNRHGPSSCNEANNQIIGRRYTVNWLYCKPCQDLRTARLKEAFKRMYLRMLIAGFRDRWTVRELRLQTLRIHVQCSREATRLKEAFRAVPDPCEELGPDDIDPLWLEPAELDVPREMWAQYRQRMRELLHAADQAEQHIHMAQGEIAGEDEVRDDINEVATELLHRDAPEDNDDDMDGRF